MPQHTKQLDRTLSLLLSLLRCIFQLNDSFCLDNIVQLSSFNQNNSVLQAVVKRKSLGQNTYDCLMTFKLQPNRVLLEQLTLPSDKLYMTKLHILYLETLHKEIDIFRAINHIKCVLRMCGDLIKEGGFEKYKKVVYALLSVFYDKMHCFKIFNIPSDICLFEINEINV